MASISLPFASKLSWAKTAVGRWLIFSISVSAKDCHIKAVEMFIEMVYPLVNYQFTMERSTHFEWEINGNQLFLWPCSIAILTQPEGMFHGSIQISRQTIQFGSKYMDIWKCAGNSGNHQTAIHECSGIHSISWQVVFDEVGFKQTGIQKCGG